MKKFVLCGLSVFIAGAVFAADSAAEVKAAAKKLADKGNYSWKSTTGAGGGGGAGGGRGRGFGGGPTEGKVADGVTYLTTTRGENTTEVVLQGTKGAIKLQDGWQSISEAGEGQGPGRFIGRMYQDFKAPAAQAEELAGQVKELKKDGDAYSGVLTEEGAKSRLTFGRRRAGGDGPEISDAKGTAKFWVKDGVLSKYEYNVQGSISFTGNDREVNRTTTVEIKDVGTTKVTVPDEAKKKLS
jgi:hypothetical protein